MISALLCIGIVPTVLCAPPYIVMVRDVTDPRNPDAQEVRALLTSARFQEQLPPRDPFTNDALMCVRRARRRGSN